MMQADFNPRVLLHRLDVKPILMVKEDLDRRPFADLNDPKPPHIKEEQDGAYTSLEREQLNGKEEIDTIRFPVTATPIKSEDDKQSLLLSQLYQDQIKDKELPEESDGGEESIRIQDLKDGFISVETEDTEDEEDNDVKHHVSELKRLSECGLKTEPIDNDWNESRASESDRYIVSEPFSSSEFTDQFDLRRKHMTGSEIGSSSSLDNKNCFMDKKNVDSLKKSLDWWLGQSTCLHPRMKETTSWVWVLVCPSGVAVCPNYRTLLAVRRLGAPLVFGPQKQSHISAEAPVSDRRSL
ncbi:hypothetical protein CRENBAI_017724 [Crenichthys baileyi]|uniref:Uncharacterized protein n=1 Tax=Crenichthys baileyi TaxID=28760 RepID=A0AAV9R7X9_9TELE